ncbi:MAG TPA: GntR family transcriptional regulator [Peptococcaceae bacterium]|nr:GntR family transcriptional regulator [Peptococcaceae bacterium]
MQEDGMRSEDYIYNLIKDNIVKKKLFPNGQIVEAQLVKETGISRTPIRTALKRLSYEGLVTIIPNRGAFVSSPTAEEIRDVYECKKLLETAAIRLACQNITDEQIEALEALQRKEVEAHARKDLDQFIEMNDRFHLMIAEASGNMCYEKFIAELIAKSNVYLIFYDNFMFTPTNDSHALKDHDLILKALKARDAEGCVKAVERHNQITLDQLSLSGMIP